MKILITDYPETIKRDTTLEEKIIKEGLPDAEIIKYVYDGDKQKLIEVMSDCAAVKTAFVMIDKEIMDSCPKLECISFNSSGYNFVDLEYADSKGIGVTAIGEYCTDEVADHTMALLLSLNRGIKRYIRLIDSEKLWQYKAVSDLPSLKGKNLAVMGFGKIGRAVAQRAKAFGMNVMAYDPYVNKDIITQLGAQPAELEDVFEKADVISNHMLQTEKNVNFYNSGFFGSLKKRPLFINVARGGCVDEAALLAALKNDMISGAGLDVFKSEDPDLENNPFAGMDNVIITPHAAFYSNESLVRLQEISSRNLVFYLKKEYDKVNRIVNNVKKP